MAEHRHKSDRQRDLCRALHGHARLRCELRSGNSLLRLDGRRYAVVVARWLLPKFLALGITTTPQYLEERFDVRSRSWLALYVLLAYAFVTMAPLAVLLGVAPRLYVLGCTIEKAWVQRMDVFCVR